MSRDAMRDSGAAQRENQENQWTEPSSDTDPSPPPPPRVTAKKGEQYYLARPDVERLCDERQQSYDKILGSLKEANRLKTREVERLRTRSSVQIDEDEVIGLKQRLAEAETRSAQLQEALNTIGKDPARSPSFSREVVQLTRECSEIRRFCESESKAKRALEEENALLRAKLAEKSPRSDCDVKMALAVARQDLRRCIEANDGLRADRMRDEQEAREYRERKAIEINELSSQYSELQRQLSKVCNLYEELQSSCEARQIADAAKYDLLVEQLCNNVQGALEDGRVLTHSSPRRASRNAIKHKPSTNGSLHFLTH